MNHKTIEFRLIDTGAEFILPSKSGRIRSYIKCEECYTVGGNRRCNCISVTDGRLHYVNQDETVITII